MPTTATSFVAERTRGERKIFDTLDAALFEETKALHEELIAAVTFLHFVDGVSIADQFDRLRPKFASLKSKALEWETARAARAEEFTQRAAADIAAQELYWSKFYENKERIARAIARDVARREQRRNIEETNELPTPHDQSADSQRETADQKPAETDRPVCEICGKPMIRKTGKFGKFLACSGYPTCKHTQPLAESAETPADNLVEMRRAA